VELGRDLYEKLGIEERGGLTDGINYLSGYSLSQIFIDKNEAYTISESDVLPSSYSVVLGGDNAGLIFYHKKLNETISQKLHSLTVRNGEGWFSFKTYGNNIYLDNLIIENGAFLRVDRWSDVSDSILVKKSSAYLENALGKIKFNGLRGSVGVRDYNSDYWEIGVGHGFGQLPVPEPAVYGAVFSLGVLGFVAWRRRGKRSLLKS